MKSQSALAALALSGALLAGGAQAQAYNEDGSIWYVSEPTEQTLFTNPAGASTKITWKVNSYGETNLDTLDRYVVLEHIIQAPIFKTDTITFELQFSGKNVALTAEQLALFAADAAQCTVANNSMDPEYWAQSVLDGYYYVQEGETVRKFASDLTANQDWTVWEEDNSNNVNSPYCTYDSAFFDPAVQRWESIYECTQVKCTMRRKLTTADEYDWYFDVDTADDELEVAYNLGFVQFN